MHLFAMLRLILLGTTLLFSLITLGLAANLVDKLGDQWSFPGFAVAVSVLTILAVVPMIVIDLLRRGALMSWVVVELPIMGILWVLWLSSAALSTSVGLFLGDCSSFSFDSALESLCRQYSALQAFSWLNWLLVKTYVIVTLALAILALMKGHKRVWFSPVSDLSFSPTHTHSGEPKIPPPATAPGGYNPDPRMAHNHSASPSSGYPPNQPPTLYSPPSGQYPPQQQPYQSPYPNQGPAQYGSPVQTYQSPPPHAAQV
ncbi:SubName: Full=Uncharacterized protein {ECO:0000313/EMBL:CCA66612.1} [Serendipita indica DSM 11827]|uniref:MARVEL domain-containing protein n=1 Tax=Serendipita indica (strain DSM 11827) TaxID=1109443 RepID=G4T5M8_SERID|nr:SubName: Full=Uncharacterized protein {ECO:0000313/EMBL:CCA66612.1} [Serendipita indica DSM 11827]CCA66612.1 hypothetical protein PIIN_00295 [Serendipita indica DSM 11827]